LTSREYDEFINKTLPKFPHTLEGEVLDTLYEVAKEVTKDQVVIFKRDPVSNRNNYSAASIIPVKVGQVAVVNSLDLAPMGGDCMQGHVVTFKKVNNDFISTIEKIDNFYKNHKLTFIEKRIIDDKVIYDYLVNDEVYSMGINESTGKPEYSKIQRWSIHNNINLIKISVGSYKSIISNKKSFYCYNINSEQYQKLDLDEVVNNENDLEFISMALGRAIHLPTKKLHTEPYINNETIKISIGDVYIETKKDKIGYDFTMEHPDIKSFIDFNGFVHPNCDGDTIMVASLLSEDAKEAAKRTMHPLTSKTKYQDIVSMNGQTYSFAQDVLATIFYATR
jgi:hypothetical protein